MKTRNRKSTLHLTTTAVFIVNRPRIVVNLASYEDVLSANFKIIEMLTLNDDKKSRTNLTKN